MVGDSDQLNLDWIFERNLILMAILFGCVGLWRGMLDGAHEDYINSISVFHSLININIK